MSDFAQVIGFQWDNGNTRKNIEKHGVSQSEAEQLFLNEPLLIVDDSAHSHSESRFHALGLTNESRLLHVTFTLREDSTLIRVISAWDMHRKEREWYDKKTQTPS